MTNMDIQSKFIWKEYASSVQDLKEANIVDYDNINVYSKEELAYLSSQLLPTKKKEYVEKTKLLAYLEKLKDQRSKTYLDLPEAAQR